MSAFDHSSFRRISLAASGMMLWLGGTAIAQTVQVFDDAPTIEQLRSIMIPQSHPGLSRTIVIQRPDTGASSVQRASTQALPAAKPAVPAYAPSEAPAAPVMRAASTMPVQPMSPPSPPDATANASEVVAFHINFAFNSNELPQSAHAMIDTMAKLMKEAPELKLRVEGHTDAIGSVDYNVSLSERRALSVAEYLAKQGVEPSRLILVGKGMAEPLTQNPYDPANRRVQFVRVS